MLRAKKFAWNIVAFLGALLADSESFGQQQPPIDWSRLGDLKLKATVTIEPPSGVKQEAASIIHFSSSYAFATTDGAKPARYSDIPAFTAYNLANMTWEDSENHVRTELAAVQAWEKASLERTRATLAKETDAAVRAFAESMIDPKYQVSAGDGGTIVISNAHLRYVVTPFGNVPAEQAQRFYRYDRLSAYKKAMTDRKLPPSAQLAVDDILLQRNALPFRNLSLTVKTGKDTVKTDTSLRFENFQPEDAEFVKQALTKIGQTPRTASR